MVKVSENLFVHCLSDFDELHVLAPDFHAVVYAQPRAVAPAANGDGSGSQYHGQD